MRDVHAAHLCDCVRGRPRAWSVATLRAMFVEIAASIAIVPFWPLWLVLGGVYQAAEEGEGKARGRRNPIILTASR